MLLPFGSLVPGIMLPILASIYILYFGASILSKDPKVIEKDFSETQPEKVYFIEQFPSDQDLVCYFYGEKNIKPAVTGYRDIFLKFYSQSVSQILFISDEKIIPALHSFYLFSRPPPAEG